MKHIANTARGQLAKNQSELLKIAMNQSPMKTETMDLPIAEIGFSRYGDNGLERMQPEDFLASVMTLLKTRPSARLWDVIPEVPYTEEVLLEQSPEAFRMSWFEQADFLKDEFMRRPKMAGFRIEKVNVEGRTDGSGSQPSVTIAVYETTDDLDDSVVPLTIRVKYRANW